MIELKASIIKNLGGLWEFAFGEADFKYGFFEIPYNSQRPLSIVQDFKNKVNTATIRKIFWDECGEEFSKINMEAFIKSLIRFAGSEDPKWKYRDKYDDYEYLLKPIILE